MDPESLKKLNFVSFADYDWSFSRKGWLPWNPIAYCIIASFCAVAYWMSVELLVLVYVTFKRHSGLYFWAIVITTMGIILQTTGYILKSFENDSPPILVLIICKVGWVSNVTGFSVVLWSRLHLVVNSTRTLKYILMTILFNGFICHTPLIIIEFGLISANPGKWHHPMEIMERIQQTIFSLQETIISCLYIYYTAKFLNDGYPMHTRKVICLLLAVQVLVVGFDATLTAIDYADWFTLKCTLHPFIYSVKLKLEFIVLNQLQGLIRRGSTPGLGISLDLPPSDESLPPAEMRKPPPSFDRGFITKAGAAMEPPAASPLVSITSPTDEHVQSLGNAKHDSCQSLQDESDEYDLKILVGRPDFRAGSVDDIERQYLGKWDASTR